MDKAIRVAVFGTESTGKTRLAEALSRRMGAALVAEYAREYWDTRGGITLEDIPLIAREQWRREDAAAAGGGLVICDTEALTTMLWSDLLYGECPEEVRRGAEERCRGYSLYLLCDVDVPFVTDPQRCFPDTADRLRAGTIWRRALDKRRLPYALIEGSWADRERAATDAVFRLLEKPSGPNLIGS